jgi:hypothetical protein
VEHLNYPAPSNGLLLSWGEWFAASRSGFVVPSSSVPLSGVAVDGKKKIDSGKQSGVEGRDYQGQPKCRPCFGLVLVVVVRGMR